MIGLFCGEPLNVSQWIYNHALRDDYKDIFEDEWDFVLSKRSFDLRYNGKNIDNIKDEYIDISNMICRFFDNKRLMVRWRNTENGILIASKLPGIVSTNKYLDWRDSDNIQFVHDTRDEDEKRIVSMVECMDLYMNNNHNLSFCEDCNTWTIMKRKIVFLEIPRILIAFLDRNYKKVYNDNLFIRRRVKTPRNGNLNDNEKVSKSVQDKSDNNKGDLKFIKTLKIRNLDSIFIYSM